MDSADCTQTKWVCPDCNQQIESDLAQMRQEILIHNSKCYMKIYKDNEHFIGTFDIDNKEITSERLLSWAKNPKRLLLCIFCGSTFAFSTGWIHCSLCKEYKGIMPDC